MLPKVQQYDEGPQVVLNHDENAPELNRAEDWRREKYFVSSTQLQDAALLDPDLQNHSPLPHTQRKKRICGLRRRIFIPIAILIALVVVVTAVIGGVFGSKPKATGSTGTPTTAAPTNLPTSSTIPVSASKGGGLSITAAVDGSSNLFVYWQDESGSIMEGQYSSVDLEQGSKATVVEAGNARSNTPISSLVWTGSDNVQHRALFYVDPSNHLMTVNTTSDPWTQPLDVLSDTGDLFAANGIGLAACADSSSVLNGFRVYYASETNYIGECGTDFGAAVVRWGSGEIFYEYRDADINSGVACTIAGSVMTTYYRSSSTHSVASSWYDFGTPGVGSWKNGSTGPSVSSGIDFTAIHDASGDLLFWQNTDGTIEMGQNGSTITALKTLDTAWYGSKIAAATSNTDETVLLYQSQANQTLVSFERIDPEDNTSIASGWIS